MTTQQDAETMSRVGVVGGGLMGSGIAEVCAAARCDVVVREIDDAACAVARHRVEASLARAVKASKVSGTDRDAILDRIRFTTELDELGDRDLVIEAIVEDELAKAEVFAQLDKVVEADDAVFASNTSSIPIMKLAMATSRPHSVLGLHFFNPVPILRLPELIPPLLTAPEVTARAAQIPAVSPRHRRIRPPDPAGVARHSPPAPH